MPKVTDEHRAAMRDRIQQSAIEVVRTKGLAALTMGDIIKTSGLSAGAIYGYYKGKDELVVDVARTVMADRQSVLEDLTSRTPVPPPATMVRELLTSIPTEWLRGGLLLQFWTLANTHPPVMEQVQDLAGGMFGSITLYLTAWLRQEGRGDAEARQDADLLAPVVAGLAQGFILQTSIWPGVDADAYAASAAAVLHGALRGHPDAED